MAKEQLKKKEWQAIIVQYKVSGKKNQSDWCRENGVNIRNFNRWYNKLKGQASSTPTAQSWIPVQITEKSHPHNHSLSLKIGKVSIEVKDDFNPTLLTKVVKVLGEIC